MISFDMHRIFSQTKVPFIENPWGCSTRENQHHTDNLELSRRQHLPSGDDQRGVDAGQAAGLHLKNCKLYHLSSGRADMIPTK
jgi:hypothetical protein